MLIITILIVTKITYAADISLELKNSKEEVTIMTTPSGIRFGVWGKVVYPAPTLFIFSGTIEQSLGNPIYRQSGNQLSKEGFLCVSLDLPGHGQNRREEEPEGLPAWRYRSDKGEDFVTPFVEDVRSVLAYLIKIGYSDAKRVAVCGTSRGGFMALQVTAAEKLIKATAAYCPVTELIALREYDNIFNPDFVESLSIKSKAEQLIGRSLWLIIGDRDERVGTDYTIQFAQKVTKLSLEKTKDSDVTLIVQPESEGHTTPVHAPQKAALWILEKLKKD